MGLAAATAVCVLGCSTVERAHERGTQFTISGVMTALDCFEVDCTRFPTTAEGLPALTKNPGVSGWRGPYWEGAFLDQWGTPLRYELVTNSLSLRSAGRDRAFGTADDIVQTRKW